MYRLIPRKDSPIKPVLNNNHTDNVPYGYFKDELSFLNDNSHNLIRYEFNGNMYNSSTKLYKLFNTIKNMKIVFKLIVYDTNDINPIINIDKEYNILDINYLYGYIISRTSIINALEQYNNEQGCNWYGNIIYKENIYITSNDDECVKMKFHKFGNKYNIPKFFDITPII